MKLEFMLLHIVSNSETQCRRGFYGLQKTAEDKYIANNFNSV